MESTVKNLFKEICNELGIKCTLLSKDWIFMLEKDGKTRFLAGYKSSLNDHALGMVIDDKYALYDVLNTKNMKVAKYDIIYGEKNTNDYALGCNNFQYVKDLFYKYNCEVVMKPNDGTCGRDVYLVKDLNTLEELYNKLTRKYFSINIGPFYHIKNEYRFVVFDGDVRICYKKNKPVVYGDGIRTIRDLLMEFNPEYFNDKLQDIIYDRVLDVNEEYEYNWKFNLSQGAIASEIDNQELENRLKELAISSSREIGLKFGSVDIIVTEDNQYLILEMNSGVMIDNYIEQFSNGYNNAKDLYKEVIIEMFKTGN